MSVLKRVLYIGLHAQVVRGHFFCIKANLFSRGDVLINSTDLWDFDLEAEFVCGSDTVNRTNILVLWTPQNFNIRNSFEIILEITVL